MATDWLLVFCNTQIIEQFHVTSRHVRKGSQSCGRWTFNFCKNFLSYHANTFTNLLATWVRTLYYNNLMVLQLPGHRLVLHDWDWELEPWHLAPPPDGGGFVQVRMRDCDPPPQVWLQEPQTPQSDHPPLTKIKTSFCYVAIVVEGQVL